MLEEKSDLLVSINVNKRIMLNSAFEKDRLTMYIVFSWSTIMSSGGDL
jgi:hypothetical protein